MVKGKRRKEECEMDESEYKRYYTVYTAIKVQCECEVVRVLNLSYARYHPWTAVAVVVVLAPSRPVMTRTNDPWIVDAWR